MNQRSDRFLPPRPTEIAHTVIRAAVTDGDCVVDATAGNGHDTVFLAHLVGPCGHVHAFDPQPDALNSARERITQAGLENRVTFHPLGHESLAAHVPNGCSAVVFNLGYLPGGDHGITTRAATTIPALRAAASLLKPGGLLSVLCYPGHAEGAEELDAITREWADWAAVGWRIARYDLPFTASPAPVLWLAAKV